MTRVADFASASVLESTAARVLAAFFVLPLSSTHTSPVHINTVHDAGWPGFVGKAPEALGEPRQEEAAPVESGPVEGSGPDCLPEPLPLSEPVPVSAQVRELLAALPEAQVPGGESLQDVEAALAVCEDVKNALTGYQAKLALALHSRAAALDAETRNAEDPVLGVRRHVDGVGKQVALARRVSQHAGARFVGLARILHTELPHTRAALEAGVLGEFQAMIVAAETAHLTWDARISADEQLAADTGGVQGLGNRRLKTRVAQLATALDPASAVKRHEIATRQRCVSLRPAATGMVYLTALLPTAAGISAYRALHQATQNVLNQTSKDTEPRSETGTKESRSEIQVMADEFVRLLTGTTRGYTSVEVQLVITDRTLIAGDSEPALLPGYDVLSGADARAMITACPDVSLRKLYTAPTTGELIGMESRSRIFPPGLRRFIATRDQT